MSAVKSTIRNGKITLPAPAGWPEGAEVLIQLAGHTTPQTQAVTGMSDEVQGDDAESIDRWIAAFDAIPPLQMTPSEEAEWQAARQAQRESELTTFNERADRQRRLLE